jgi:hypothetical protein
MRFAVRNGKYYNRRESNDGRGIESHVLEYSYDGEYHYIGQHNRFPDGYLQPLVSMMPASRSVREHRVRHADYFYWAGISIPFSSFWSLGTTEITSQLLAMLSAGFQILSIDSDNSEPQPLVKIVIQGPNPDFEKVKNVTLDQVIAKWRSLGIDEKRIVEFSEGFHRVKNLPPLKQYVFYFDPSRSYAVIHFEEYDHQDKLEIRRTNSDFHPLQRNPTVWLPRRIVTQRFSWRGYYENTGHPRYTESIEVNSISEDEIAADVFTLTAKYSTPGTQVVTFGDDDGFGKMTTIPGGPSPQELKARLISNPGADHDSGTYKNSER